MSSGDAFLANLLRALGQFFEPLDRASDGGEPLRTLLGQLGWALEPGAAAAPAAITQIAGSVVDLAGQADALLGSDEQAASTAQSKALGDVLAIARGVGELAGNAAVIGADFQAVFADTELPEKLLDLLAYDYLADHKPQIFAIARLAGILDETHVTPGPNIAFAKPFLKRQVRFDRVGMAVTDLGSLPADVYGWGTPAGFRAGTLLRVLEVVGRAFGLAISDDMSAGLDLYWDADTVASQAQRSLVLPVWSGVVTGPTLGHGQLDIVIVPIPPVPSVAQPTTRATKPEGIAVFPRFVGDVSTSVVLLEGVTLTASGHIEEEGSIRAVLRPSGSGLVVAPTVTEFSVTVGIDVKPTDPFVVIGAAGSSRLEIAHAHFELGIGEKLGVPQMHVETALDKASLVIDLGKGDGFLQKLLGGEPQQLDFGAGVKWSTEEGLRFNGTATLRLELPVHLDLAGVAHIDTIHLVLGAATSPAGAQLEVSITGGLTLGPFAAEVDRLGVAMNLVKKADHKGSLGDMDLVFAFKPPTGLGFVVDAGPVKGGGYVSFDPEAGEYAGILDLEIAGKLAIKAIGILATKMPDGRPGFSMLLIITAEFPPIQLGYGFTLNGVGGAIGINRTMNQDFLSTGIHTGVLESLLFPPDPVAHATEIISNLKQGFPIAQGRFIFGPMIKLGWASIISIEAGVLLELPLPVRLALLGRLSVKLPDPDDAVLILQLDIAGFIDFGTGDIAVDATLNDSRVAAFPITGDFALRANVGAKPDFALSAGGFHPRFTPPPGFKALKRLGISISSGDNPRLRLESYFAITSNTVQAGARADFFVGADLGILGNLSAEALLGFDALFHFSPFSFEVDVYGSAAIKRNGEDLASADLEFVLAGVSPWHVYGHATVHFLGDHSLPFDRTFGTPALPQPAPATDVAALVRTAVGLAGAWGAALPGDARPLVTLRDIGPDAGVLLHPLGRLSVHQRVAPLGTHLDKYGSGPIGGASVITIDLVTIDDHTGVGLATQGVAGLDDGFSPAQFFDLTDDQKLSRPSFERLPAGKIVQTSSFGTAAAQTADQHYVTITVDRPDLLPVDPPFVALGNAYRTAGGVRESMAELAGAGRAQPAGRGRYAAPAQGIAVDEPAWTIAKRTDLSATTTHATYTEAANALGPSTGVGDQRIVGAFEAVPA